MKYHFVYKVTNLLNEKYYIGVHSTNNLDDGYLGSGRSIFNAVLKYGKENFKREILEFLETAEEKWIAETKYVNLDVVKDENSYNMALGGRNWIAAMKRENDPSFKEHQSKAGKIGAKAFLNSLSQEEKKDWHSKGGKSASKKTIINKTGFYNPLTREKQKKAVSDAIKNTVELWHPDAPEEVTNRNSKGYVSGFSVRAKPNSEKYFSYIAEGYVQREKQDAQKSREK